MITDDNLNQFLKYANTEPQEAANNIHNAGYFGVDPDTYSRHKESLEPEVEAFKRTPAKVEEVTKQYITENEQQAALAKNDYEKLNFLEKRLKYYDERIFEIPELRRKKNEIINKGMRQGFTDSEREQLEGMRFTLDDMQQNTYGIDGDVENFVVDVFSGVGDIVRALDVNKKLILSSTAIGAGVGGLATLPIPIPGSSVVGAASGAKVGFTAGATGALFLDAYKEIGAETWDELDRSLDAEGNPLNLDDDSKLLAAQGVAMVAGFAGAFAGRALVKANPWLQKFVSGKAAASFMTKSPAMLAKMKIAGSIAKSMAAEGGEEALQEFAQIAGVEFAKMDETEGSFVNALNNIFSEETLKRAGYSSLVGAGAGGVIATGTGLPATRRLTRQFADAQEANRMRDAQQAKPMIDALEAARIQDVTIKRRSTLSKQNQLVEMAAIVNSTEMKNLSPSEMGRFKKKLFETVGIDQDTWYRIDDLRVFADNPEKQKAIRNAIDNSGELNRISNELNTPISLKGNDLLSIVEEFPDFTDYLRLEPDGESPRQIRGEAEGQAVRLEQADARRAEMMESLGVDQDLSPEQQAELDFILNPPQEPKNITNEFEYFEDIRFEPIEGIVSEVEVQELNTIELDARLAVSESLRTDVDTEFQRIENREFRDLDNQDIQQQIEKLDRELKIVDRIKSKEKPITINPDTLTPEQRQLYFDQPEIKKKINKQGKVFDKNGIHIDEAAAEIGVDNGSELLQILTETPTRNQIKKQREQRKIELRNRVQQDLKPSKQEARDAAFTNLTKARLRQMQEIASKNYSTIKRGVIKIAGRPPRVETLNRKARDLLNKSKISDIKPKRFESGERNSRQKAIKAWSETKFEESYRQLEASALNNELRKEATNAQERIQKYQKFWKNVESENNQKALKKAGLLETMNEFSSLYNLKSTDRGRSPELKSFQNFIKKSAQEGRFVPVVPERLSDVTMPASEMTLELYEKVSEMGQAILHRAKDKNKVSDKLNKKKELLTQEKIAERIKEAAEKNPRYNLKKVEDTKDPTILDAPRIIYQTAMSLINNVSNSVVELDGFEVGGVHQELIGSTVKDMRTEKRQMISDVAKRDEKIARQYGLEELRKARNTSIYIPEFEGRKALGDRGNGRVRKIDLMIMLANMGDPDGRVNLQKFTDSKGNKLSLDTLQRVFDTHLTKKDAAFVQSYMLDGYKLFTEKARDLNRRTNGFEPKMIEGVPFVHQGVEFPGGYFPQDYQPLSTEVKAERFIEKVKQKVSKLISGNEGDMYAQMRSAEMTDQGRSKERTGSNRPLRLDFDKMMDIKEDIIHDLAFREGGIELMKILKNGENQKHMKAILGEKKFNNFLNGVKDSISKTTEGETTLFASENRAINAFIGGLHTIQAIGVLGFNVKSAAMQGLALVNLAQRMGPRTGLYIIKHAKKLAQDPLLYGMYAEEAAKINKDIAFEKDGIDNAVTRNSYDWMPSQAKFFKNYDSSFAKGASRLAAVRKKAIDSSFAMLRESDKATRVLTTMAVTEQFLNGDIKNYPQERLAKMSEAEKMKSLRSVVQQAATISLTTSATEDKSALEKNNVGQLFTRFWTDRRSRWNTLMSQAHKIEGNIKKGEYKAAAGDVFTTMVASAVSLGFIELVRSGGEDLLEELKGVNDTEGAAELSKELAWNFITSPFEEFKDMTPVVDNMNYAANSHTRSDYRSVSAPLFGVMSDITSGMVLTADILKGAREMEGLNPNQRRILLTNMGYAVGGFPTNSINKLIKLLDSDEAIEAGRFLKDAKERFIEEVDLFKKAYGDKPEAEQFIKDLEEYRNEVIPEYQQDPKNIIPEDATEKLKQGEWDYYDPDTGAAGMYGFTEDRWNEIMQVAPDLGLTEDGRVSKDTSEQEAAMDWQIQDATRGLLAFDIPVNNENLFGVHTFGFSAFEKIYNGKDDASLESVLDAEEKNDPVFESFKTVKDVKKYIRNKIN